MPLRIFRSRAIAGSNAYMVLLHAAMFGSFYFETSTFERYGATLPTPYSGHVTWWWWRTPPENTTTVLAVGFSEAYLRRFFDDLQVVGRLDNGLDVDTEEQGHLLIVARGPKQPLPAMWPELRHYT